MANDRAARGGGASPPKRKITSKSVPKVKTRYLPSEVKIKSLRLTASK